MADPAGIYTEVEVEAARALVTELVRVVRGFRLYEGDHPSLAEMQIRLRERWDAATAGGPLALRLTERQVLLAQEELLAVTGSKDVVPTGLFDHGVVGLVLTKGLEPTEARRLLQVLARDPGEVSDYAGLLWEADLPHLRLLVDTDDDEWESPPKTPAEFAEQLSGMADDKDPDAGEDYDEVKSQLGERLRSDGTQLPDAELGSFSLNDREQRQLAAQLDADIYSATLCHALRVVHDLARRPLGLEKAEALEKAIPPLVAGLCRTRDLPRAIETLQQARTLMGSENQLEMRVGELTLETFQEKRSLKSFLRNLDGLERIEAADLGEFFAQLGTSAAGTLGEWLIETRHAHAVSLALKVLGEGAVEVLVPLYESCDDEARSRIAPALLELGTEDALMALTSEFSGYPEQARLQLLQLVAGKEDASLRLVLVHAIEDPVERVRRAAFNMLRRQDAPAVAGILGGLFRTGGLESRTRQEVQDFFEVLSRIGNAALAEVLAEQVSPKGILRRRLTALQQLCLRALRRMRSAEARAVVDKLRQTAPKAVRDILDDPVGDLAL